MKIKLGKNQPVPKYQTVGSAGFDLCATSDTTLTEDAQMMNLEIACEIPTGYYGVEPRKHKAPKWGLALTSVQ